MMEDKQINNNKYTKCKQRQEKYLEEAAKPDLGEDTGMRRRFKEGFLEEAVN